MKESELEGGSKGNFEEGVEGEGTLQREVTYERESDTSG